MERPYVLPIAVLGAIVTLTVAAEGAKPATKSKLHRAPKPSGPVAWCAEETETLPNGLCHIDGGQPDDRRTLVVFLHGAIAKDVDWQWLQERALLRQAKQSKFEAIFARAPLGPGGYVWNASGQDEQDLIDQWTAARSFLEKRSGKPYDEVFLMGFSSGAYYTSSLALRGRTTTFDGYAVFAGGVGHSKGAAPETKPPVYVGVCADDRQTAEHSRAFGGALGALGWPSRVDEQHVGHMFSDVHVAHALTYLRKAKR